MTLVRAVKICQARGFWRGSREHKNRGFRASNREVMVRMFQNKRQQLAISHEIEFFGEIKMAAPLAIRIEFAL